MTSPVPAGYTKAQLSAWTGLINAETDAFRVLLASAYTIGTSQDDAQFLSDILPLITETTGTGYARLLLTNTASASPGPFLQQSGSQFAFFCDDLVWDPSDFVFQFAIFYDDTPALDTGKPLIGYVDYGSLLGPSGGPSTTLPANASGLFLLPNLI